MTGIPSILRVEPSPSIILAGAPVAAGRTWGPLGAAANWLNGCGAQLIPACSTRLSKAELSVSTQGVWNFYVAPRKHAIERIWVVQIVGRTSETGAEVDIWPDSEAAQTHPIPNGGLINTPLVYRQILGAQTNTPAAVKFTVQANKKHATVQSISCFEQWRPSLLEDATDGGVDTTSLRPRERVYVGAGGNKSVGGAYAALTLADARRSGIFYWAVPDASPVTRAGAYASVNGIGVPVLMRKILSGATTGTVYWSAYAKVNSNNGDVKIITSHSGVADTVNVTATSYAWTTPRAIVIDAEDLGVTDGLQGSAWDELDIQIRGNSGGTLSLAAVSVWEQ